MASQKKASKILKMYLEVNNAILYFKRMILKYFIQREVGIHALFYLWSHTFISWVMNMHLSKTNREINIKSKLLHGCALIITATKKIARSGKGPYCAAKIKKNLLITQETFLWHQNLSVTETLVISVGKELSPTISKETTPPKG